MPGSLTGPRAKVGRAKENLEALERAIPQWFQDHPYLVAPCELNPREGLYRVRVNYFVPPPVDALAVVVGEIAHDLRSGLDQLACQLAINVNETVDQSSTSFPICNLGPRSRRKRTSEDRRFNRKNVANTLGGYVARIESFQPYKRGNGGRRSPLWMLHNLNNFDKHRNIAISVVAARGVSIQGPPITPGAPYYFEVGQASITAGVPLKNGAIVGRADASYLNVDVKFRVGPEVRFGDGCEAVEGQALLPALKRMTDEVSRIIESFAGEF